MLHPCDTRGCPAGALPSLALLLIQTGRSSAKPVDHRFLA
jgi:hypothetical protein